MSDYYYILLDLLTLSFPLAYSFDKRMPYVRYWRGVFLGIAVMCLLFIPWDVWFTSIGVWGFNEQYLLGITLVNLPIEEWLFFFVVPFACVFIYEVLNYYLPRPPLELIQDRITGFLILVSFVVAVLGVQQLYTFTTFSLLTLLLIWHLLINKSPYMGKFYLAFVVIQLPFLLVNGGLTGLYTEEPVVWYNNMENSGVRILTIPVEDVGYNMLMLLLVVTVHEMHKARVLRAALSTSRK